MVERGVVFLLIDTAKWKIGILGQKFGDREIDQFGPPVEKWGTGGLGIIFLGGLNWS